MSIVERGVLLERKKQLPIPYYHVNPYLPTEVVMIALMHGNEWYAKKPMMTVAEEHVNGFGMIVIPEVSPQAALQNTRENGQGQDINRGFKPGTNVYEAAVLMNFFTRLVTRYGPLQTIVAFHGDGEFYDQPYLYEDGLTIPEDNVDAFRTAISKLGIPLFNGIDGPNDPALGIRIVDGIAQRSTHNEPSTNGTFDNWVIENGIAQRVICLELPKYAPERVQIQIAQAAYTHLALSA